jgi:hypothetical protein
MVSKLNLTDKGCDTQAQPEPSGKESMEVRITIDDNAAT